MKIMIVLILILAFADPLNCQIGSMIPAERLPDLENGVLPWQKAGYISQLGGELIAISRFIDIKARGAVGDGLSDDTTVINSAIAEASAESDSSGFTMIYFPTGIYLITETLYLSSNSVIKGNGSNETVLLFSLENGDYIEINGLNDTTRCVRTGVEDLSLIRDDDNSTSSYNGMFFHFNYAQNCWLRGVEAYHAARHHVYISYSNNIEIRGCYFHTAESYGSGGRGYGVQIGYYSSKCLIEDNVFRRLRHAMVLNDAAHHNVFGYNFSIDQHTDNEIYNLDYVTADMCIHGHNYPDIIGPYENLFEGNLGGFIRIDDAHGSNGDYNTIFRNKGRDVGIEVMDVNDNQNIVNNYFKCGHQGLSIYGFAWRVDGSGHLKKNNKCRDRDFWGQWETHWHNNDPDYNADISYYHAEQPEFMAGYPWPFYPEDDDNPAEVRENTDSIKTVLTGYKNYGLVCSGRVSLDEDVSDITEVSIKIIDQDSTIVLETFPDSSGSYEAVFAEGQFGIYKLEFNLEGYEFIMIDSIEILPYRPIPEIPDVLLNFINSPPEVVMPFLDLTLSEDFSEIETNLHYYFYDLENESLTFTATYDSSEISTSIQDSLLYLNSVLNWNGITEIIIIADDGHNFGTVQDTFLVEIIPINDPIYQPEPLTDLWVVADSSDYEINLLGYFRDIDSELSFEVEYDSLVIDCILEDNILRLNKLICWPAATEIEICATELNERSTICDTLNIFDLNAGTNRPFLLEPIADLVRFPDYEEIVFDLNENFYDCDNDSLIYNVYYNYYQIDCRVEENLLLINYISGWLGNSFINVTASDGISELPAVLGFNVRVVPDSLSTPLIMSLEVFSDSIRITWNAVDYAESYQIFSSYQPSGPEWYLEAEGITDTNLVLPVDTDKKFFRVKAVNQY